MKIAFLFAIPLLFSSLNGLAQNGKPSSDSDAAYTQTINSRAQKIVASLSITDSAKFQAVQQIIAAQYRNLSRLHTSRDISIKNIKAAAEPKEMIASNVKKTEDETAKQVMALHQQYIEQLSALLNEDQVVKVKDGMTYNVVNITYAGYLDMLPNLTTEQKAQIKTWLVEAREHAMDAETSDKKHGWFGKYKGRINNYLSAAGYDLKKEGEAWEKRLKEKQAEKNAAAN